MIIATTLRSVSLALALGAATAVTARPVAGELGPVSRGTVRINLSVAPRIEIKRPTNPRDEGMTLRSNAPGLSYTIRLYSASGEQLVQPSAGAKAGSSGAPALLLIVPD